MSRTIALRVKTRDELQAVVRAALRGEEPLASRGRPVALLLLDPKLTR